MECYEYVLRSAGELNPLASRREFRGALLRADGGYGCLHPWPELGDFSLEQELAELSRGGAGPLGRRALACCRVDGEARRAGRSLWSGLTIPESHFTLGAAETVPEGFRLVKVKGGADLKGLCGRLDRLPGDLRIRLDCNGVLDGLAGFLRFWAALEPWWERIDFVEDPCAYDEGLWRELERRTGVRLALDRWEGPAPEDRIRVIKPAVQADWRGAGRLVFTSSMDHPVGQLFAAWCAAREVAERPERVLLCGLVTHHLFNAGADPFLEALGPPRPVLVPPAGTGLGWDDLLEALPWKTLS
ncbi:MAG: O-succinylbenzoate synthase [Verrucomicrobia bacterium]|nr:MAG: O-succinylbenzoate synthase [Verrucomicrobiota bacterium]